MKISLNIKRRIFNDTFYPYLKDYSNKYEVWYGGAGSGKSVFVTQKIVIKAITTKRKILIMRKVGATLKDSVWQLTLDTLSKFGILEFSKVNKSTFSIELPNGSILLFKGMDDSEKIKSITGITDIWVEEATEFSAEEIDQLILRLRANVDSLQMFFTFNPVSKANWVYKRWFADDEEHDDTVIHKSTYRDNKFLPDEYIESILALKESNPTYFRIYAEGEFSSLDKLVFSSFQTGVVGDTSQMELCCGLDFGFVNDPSAFIVSFINEDEKILYIAKEWVKKGTLNDEIARVIAELGFSKSQIIADSAEQKSIEEMRRLGLYRIKPASKGQGSVLQGIQKLQQYRIIINPECENTITEFQNYSWQKDRATGEYINKPIDEFNHCIDALRYSIQCMENRKRLTTINKSYLGL